MRKYEKTLRNAFENESLHNRSNEKGVSEMNSDIYKGYLGKNKFFKRKNLILNCWVSDDNIHVNLIFVIIEDTLLFKMLFNIYYETDKNWFVGIYWIMVPCTLKLEQNEISHWVQHSGISIEWLCFTLKIKKISLLKLEGTFIHLRLLKYKYLL